MAYKTIAVVCMLILPIFHETGRAEEEIRMTLYVGLSEYDGPNPNAVWTLDKGGATRFGSIAMVDLSLSDGPGPGAKIIGRALHQESRVSSRRDSNIRYTALNLLLKGASSWFSGSTLHIEGLSPPGDCEWSIVGGTGNLAMAGGIVRKRVITQPGSSKSAQLNIHVYYNATMNAIKVSGNMDSKKLRRELHENI